MKMKHFTTVALAMAIMPLTANAEELRFAIGYPPNTMPVNVMEDYAEKVAELSGGELTVNVFPSSLLSFQETSSGVRDGIASMGLLSTGYNPSDYPINNLVPNTTIQLINFGDEVRGREAVAFASAVTEYIFFHCPDCNEEFAEQNQVFTSIASTSAYYLMCNQPIGSLEDVQGLRMRAPTNWARWTDYVGGSSTSVALAEMNEAMSQGAVDCLVASAPELLNWNLTNLITDIAIGVPGGVAAGAPVNINQDTWQALSTDERKVLMEAGAFSQAQYAWMFHQREADALEAARAAGARVAEADVSLIEKTREFVIDDTEAMLDDIRTRYDIENGREMLNTFAPILQKWVDKTADVESVEQLEEMLWSEIFSKVDVDKHGF